MFVAILLFGVLGLRENIMESLLLSPHRCPSYRPVGSIMPDRYYVTLSAYYLTLTLAGIAVLVSFVKQRHRMKSTSSVSSKNRLRLAIALSAAGLALWMALLLLWRLSGYSSFNIWWDCPRCAITVPPYLYPSRFGILGLLSIPAVAFALFVWRKETRGVALVCGLAIVALVLGRFWMFPQLYKYTGLEEFRWNKYAALALTSPNCSICCADGFRDNVRKRTVSTHLPRRVFVGAHSIFGSSFNSSLQRVHRRLYDSIDMETRSHKHSRVRSTLKP